MDNGRAFFVALTSPPVVFLLAVLGAMMVFYSMWSASQRRPEQPMYPSSEAQFESGESDDAVGNGLHPVVEAGLQELARRGEALVHERGGDDLGITPEQADALRDLGPLPTSEEEAREQARQAKGLLTPEQIERLKTIKEEVWSENLKRELQGIGDQLSEEDKRALHNRAEDLRQQYKQELELLDGVGPGQ